MSQHSMRNSQDKPTLRSFENNGFLYGLGLGALIGVVVAGPHFREWSLLTTLGTRVQIRSATLNNWLGGRDALAFAPLDRQVKVTRI